MSGQTLLIENVRGSANGGYIALDGALQVEGLSITGGALNIQAQAVAIEILRGLRSEVDALVIYRPDPKAPSLTGDIRIAQSAYTETITIASLARRATLPVSPTAERPYLDRIRLNLAVTTTEDMLVDNNYGRLEAGADLRVVGTVAEPGVDGRITLREGGEIFLAGRTFRITRGDISFTDLRHIHPEFNIAAEARIGTDDVTMTLTGTLERPQLDLTTLAGSMTPGEIASLVVGNPNAETALTLLSADLLGVTGRAIGLDAFRVERGDYTDRDFKEDPTLIGGTNQIDPTTRLTIGKRLSDQVEVTISQNLRESGKTTFVISFLPRHNVEVRALSRDNATVSLGIRHQVTLGPGSATRPIERRVRPTVSEIRFEGVEPALEQEVRTQLKLGSGDDFDFLVLQRDIDRVSEMFHEQGFLEARVRTRRIEDTDTNTVTVEYRVERGPRTILLITGATLPAGEIEQLQEAWHRNTFDQFLIEDLTGRVRRYLVTQNEIASIVVGTIDRPTPDSKRVRIDITPGASVTSREIRFTGNEGIDAKELQEEVTASGIDVEAWLDRTVLERELQTLYNEQGFLKAQVTAGPLDIDGDTGVLPVTIVEGPRAQVMNVSWAGVPETRLAEVQKAAAIETPTPFDNSEITEARRRIEQHYRTEGFNAAEVEIQSKVAEDDTVTLLFEVTEGPQQLLQEVVTTGNEITSDKVITQALQFELGKPANLDEWARARKRLYDTNVFRQVDIQAVPMGEVVDGVQPVKAQVSVVEYPAWSLRYGTQLENERKADIEEFTSSRNLGLVGEVKNPNLFGRALTLGLFGQYEREQQDATVLLATSRLFGWRARSTLYGFYSHARIRDEEGLDIVALTNRTGVSADQRWRFSGIQVVYGYRFERNRTFDPTPSPGDPFPLDFVVNLARLSGAALFDRRDDPLSARKGTFTAISWDHSGLWLGSDVSNRKLLAQQHTFFPLGGRLVLASRVQAGFVFGPDDLLPSDAFRAGGATTVRGYGEDSLGPRDVLGIPSGGEMMVILNHEARFPIHRWVHGVGFIDAGNIFGKDEPFSFGALKIGYGIGLRFNTPLGMFRADIGIPRTALSATRSTTRFHFGFGHIF
jgi:outer membrane protein insertion porin family